MKKALLILAIFSFLTACASSYPLGMSEEQWNSITPEERQALLLKQQKYEEEQRAIRMKAQAEQRKLELQQEIAEKQRLDRLYSDPQNGNVVMLNILGGNYQYGKKTKHVLEESYEIARGETKQIQLVLEEPKKHYHTTQTAYLQYTLNGNAVYLYLDNPKYNSSKRIALLRDGNWTCGSNYQKHLYGSYESLKDMTFFIKEMGSHCNHRRRHY
ncbi:MAG: hypothetical protein R3254_06845 [Thiomicrorhabdus sp.]|nr:hypothetical protein [Thiomicrorhabdus sp.]